MKTTRFALAFLIAVQLVAGPVRAEGTYSKGGGGVILVTESTLPAVGDATKIYRITDATSASDCAAGTPGTNRADCRWNGSAYEPIGVAASGLTNPLVSDMDGGGNDINNVATVDGRDVSVDGSKLDGIPDGARTMDQAGGEKDFRYDATRDAYYIDANGNGSRATDGTEPFIDTIDIHVPSDYASIQLAVDSDECKKGTTTPGAACRVLIGIGSFAEKVEIGDPSVTANFQNAVILQGAGAGYENSLGDMICGTVLTGDGSLDHTVIAVMNTSFFVARDLCIDMDTAAANDPLYGITIGNSQAAANVQKHGLIESVTINDQGAVGGAAILLGNGGVTNSDTTFNTIRNVLASNVRECLRVDSQQTVDNKVNNFQCSNPTASIGGLEITQRGGSLKVDGFFYSTQTASQTGINVRNEALGILKMDGLEFEWGGDNGTFINFDAAANTGAGRAIHITNSRFQPQVIATTRHVCIDWNRVGTLNLTSNSFESSNSAMTCEIDLHNPDNFVPYDPSVVNFHGNDVQWSIPSTSTLVVNESVAGSAGPLVVNGDVERNIQRIGQGVALRFEGSTLNGFETDVVVADPTADRTMTIPNANSNPVVPTTCGGSDKVSGISSSGVVTCSPDGGSSVATDPFWDAVGDLALGTGVDTAARLAKGSAGQALIMESTGTTPVWEANPGGGQAGLIAALTTKATPVANDILMIEDSAASNAKRDTTVGGMETALEGVLDLLDLQDGGAGTCSANQSVRRNAGDTAFECFTPGAASLPVPDTTSIAEGSADGTKEVRLEVDGLTTGTVRVLTMPDANVDLGALGASNLGPNSVGASELIESESYTVAGLTVSPNATDGGCFTLSEGTDDGAHKVEFCVSDSNLLSGDTQIASAFDTTGRWAADALGADSVGEPKLDLIDGDTASDEDCLTYEAGTGGTLEFQACGGGGGAPTTVDYLVGTADAGLSGEIVVGTAPGGELGGTWASPALDDGLTVDDWTLTDADVDTARLALGTVTAAPSTSQNDYSPTGWDGTHPSKATVLRISPTATINLTGLAGGIEGRVARLVNGTGATGATGRLIILPNESASSSAANRFSFTRRTPVLLFPGDSIDLLYDGTASRWRVVGQRGEFDVFGENASPMGTTGHVFGTNTSSTGATCQGGTYLVNSTTYMPLGLTECDTGSTATGRAALALNSVGVNSIPPEQGAFLFLTRVAVEVLADGTEDYEVAVGLHDGANSQPFATTDGVFWLYDQDTSASWQACSKDGGTSNCQVIGPTVDTNYIWLGVFLNGDWTAADFFYSTDGVAWTLAGSETTETNLPDAGDFLDVVPLLITKETGATQRDVNADFSGYRYEVVR